MTKNSAFRATVEYEIMLNYNCPSRSSIFFSAVFIEITVLYSEANRGNLESPPANVSSLAKSQEIYLRFTISMPSCIIKITFNYPPDLRKAFCPEPGILK